MTSRPMEDPEAHESDSLLRFSLPTQDNNTTADAAATTTGGSTTTSGASSFSRRHHRRATSGMESVLEAIQEGVVHVVENVEEMAQTVFEGVENVGENIVESVVEEIQEVKEVFVEEMHEADDGESFFLEMSLARNLSILPTDIVATAVEQQQEALEESDALMGVDFDESIATEKPHRVTPTTPTPISAYFLLASAVVSLSSIGPLLDLQKDNTPTMKIYWRMSATAMTLFPFAVYSYRREGFPTLTTPQWTVFLMAAAAYATMCVGFVTSLSYTSVGNAVILSNSQAIMLLVAKFFVGQRVLPLEASGALVAFSGAVLCSKDSADSKPSEGEVDNGKLTLLGDFFALVSGMGGCTYLVLAKSVRNNVPLYQFMFLIMAVGSTLVLCFIAFVLREDFEFSRNDKIGIWGWMNLEADRFPLEVTMVVVCNMLGALGYVRAMQYFDSLVIAVAALMEPVVAEFLAFFVGVGFLPGWMGWLGNLLVAGGTLAVIAPSAMSGKSVGH